MTDVRLLLTCGLPGSGKTTLAVELAERHQAVRLTKDEWQWRLGSSPWDRDLGEKLESELWNLAQQLLQHDVSVVLDFGLWARAERDELRTAARRLGVGVELHYLQAPLHELWRRVEERNSAPPWEDEPISRASLGEWHSIFQAPDATEAALFDTPDHAAAEVGEPTLVLFCGPPGSGKTTLAKALDAEGRGLRLCTDEWQDALGVEHSDETFHERLQTCLYELALDVLDVGRDVILEDGLWTKAERDQKLTDARHHQFRTELHLFDLTFEQLWVRIHNRNEGGPAESVRIEKTEFERIWARFELPEASELANFSDYERHGVDSTET